MLLFFAIYVSLLLGLPAAAFVLSPHQQWLRFPRQKCEKSSLFSFSNDDGDSIDGDDFMKSLRTRMEEVQDSDTKLPLVVLDCMLPRQVLKIQVNNPVFMELVKTRMVEETPSFGMLGMARVNTGQQAYLKHGVEVQIEGRPQVVATAGGKGGDAGLRVELKAGRRFRIEGEVDNAKQGWTEARVSFFDSAKEEEEEELNGSDRMSLARAMAKARAFTSPNVNMVDSQSLVDRWVQLARENERQPGQIDQLLEDLGDAPSVEEPSELAFWVGALINPIPAMGVALEIRPALLTAKTAEERVQVALDGILRSIRHMDGSAPIN